jgi:hypothetical protein
MIMYTNNNRNRRKLLHAALDHLSRQLPYPNKYKHYSPLASIVKKKAVDITDKKLVTEYVNPTWTNDVLLSDQYNNADNTSPRQGKNTKNQNDQNPTKKRIADIIPNGWLTALQQGSERKKIYHEKQKKG